MRPFRHSFPTILCALAVASAAAVLPCITAHPAMAQAGGRGAGGARGGAGGAPARLPSDAFTNVYRRRVNSHWFAGNTKFWYRNDLPDQKKEFILVEVEAAKRAPAFDHQKLAAALSKAAPPMQADKAYAGDRLPFNAIDMSDDGKSVRFTVGDATWRCDLATYQVGKDGGPAVNSTSDPVPTADNGGRIGLSAEADIEEDAADIYAAPDPNAGGRGGAAAGGAGARGGGRGAGRGAGAGRGGQPAGPRGGGPITSADGKWTASVVNNNVVISAPGGDPVPLSTDGVAGDGYSFLSFSPDSSTLLAWKMQPGDRKEVYRVQSSPPGRNGAIAGGVGRTVLLTTAYALPGDKFDTYELNLFDLATKKQTKPQVERLDMSAGGGDPSPQSSGLRWRSDGFHFTFEKYDRGHQRVRVIEVNAHTGGVYNIIDEQAKTFIWTAHTDTAIRMLTYLGDNEMIYSSEVDGWRHYYLVDSRTPADEATAKTPEMKHITRGEWIVRGFDSARDSQHPAVDTQNRVLYFTASGVYPNQDPYLVHYGHINFDGTGLVWETDGDGNHTITYSPDYKYIIDSYDRADFPGATEVRRVSDGKLVTKLETADASRSTWIKPEVFTAKGRDGKTDIWGLFYRPPGFDETKKYHVIENIYAGPHGSFVPKTFAMHPPRGSHMIGDDPGFDELLLQAGYLIVHIDGMGTANRSRAFHDVCWQNLKDAGFEDRILWMKALAAKYPFVDISNVGVFGTSAGGQSTAAALEQHPEFYKVGVANSGCHDNRMDKSSWNEQWMGYPIGPQYAASSNIDNAGKLQGRLQLVVGELDTNVPPESTYRLVDALIKDRKNFELVVVPGADHGAILPGEYIVQNKLVGWFDRYIKGIEPANPNDRPGKPPVATN
jgi:dipeptidyl aminopeptidase/acylaminoacyl peptidase